MFKNPDGTYSVFDSRRYDPSSNPYFYEQTIWGSVDGPNIKFDYMNRDINLKLLELQAGGYRAIGDYPHGAFGADFLNVDGYAGISAKDQKAGLRGFVSVAQGNIEINVPIPFTDYQLIIGGQGYLGGVGGGIEVDWSEGISEGLIVRGGIAKKIGGELIIGYERK